MNKRLTIADFLRRLRRVAPRFVWQVRLDGGIRAMRDLERHCPVSAIGGKYSSPFQSLCDEGMTQDDARRILDAANCHVPRNHDLRRRLLRAVGLEKR